MSKDTTIIAHVTKHQCDNCGRQYKEEQLREIEDFFQRVEAGGQVPSGECPRKDCGALCYPVEPKKKNPYAPLIEAAKRVIACANADIYWDAHEYPNESDRGLAKFHAAIAKLTVEVRKVNP